MIKVKTFTGELRKEQALIVVNPISLNDAISNTYFKLTYEKKSVLIANSTVKFHMLLTSTNEFEIMKILQKIIVFEEFDKIVIQGEEVDIKWVSDRKQAELYYELNKITQ